MLVRNVACSNGSLFTATKQLNLIRKAAFVLILHKRQPDKSYTFSKVCYHTSLKDHEESGASVALV
jgi:hypothetical protein